MLNTPPHHHTRPRNHQQQPQSNHTIIPNHSKSAIISSQLRGRNASIALVCLPFRAQYRLPISHPTRFQHISRRGPCSNVSGSICTFSPLTYIAMTIHDSHKLKLRLPDLHARGILIEPPSRHQSRARRLRRDGRSSRTLSCALVRLHNIRGVSRLAHRCAKTLILAGGINNVKAVKEISVGAFSVLNVWRGRGA